jgi:hypothetical protein
VLEEFATADAALVERQEAAAVVIAAARDAAATDPVDPPLLQGANVAPLRSLME